MHYRNGRRAEPGDKVLDLNSNTTGILHSINAGAETCNGRISPENPSIYVTIRDCIHLGDVKQAVDFLSAAKEQATTDAMEKNSV